jgi:hypothetical protein
VLAAEGDRARIFPTYHPRRPTGSFWKSLDDLVVDWGWWLVGAVVVALAGVVRLWLR